MYDAMLMYGGVYAFLQSQIWPMKMIYDDRLDTLCQRMVSSRKKANAEVIMDKSSLHDWKCYFYKFDLLVAKLF